MQLATPVASLHLSASTDALTHVQAADDAIRQGRCGKARFDGARATRAYRLCSQVSDAVQGENDGSTLRRYRKVGT